MKNCFAIVDRYCRQNKLAPTTLVNLGGADLEVGIPHNSENWVTVDDVLRAISHYKNLDSYRLDIPIEGITDKRKGKLEGDHVLVLLMDSHFYTVLYTHKSRAGFCADAGNLARSSRTVKDKIQRRLDILIRPLKFVKGTRADHCGASAATICLELLRLHKRGQLDLKTELDAAPALYQKLKTSLHKARSVGTTAPSNIKEVKKVWACKMCSYRSRSGRRGLGLHMRQKHPDAKWQ